MCKTFDFLKILFNHLLNNVQLHKALAQNYKQQATKSFDLIKYKNITEAKKKIL